MPATGRERQGMINSNNSATRPLPADSKAAQLTSVAGETPATRVRAALGRSLPSESALTKIAGGSRETRQVRLPGAASWPVTANTSHSPDRLSGQIAAVRRSHHPRAQQLQQDYLSLADAGG